jgi:hypothetical protein
MSARFGLESNPRALRSELSNFLARLGDLDPLAQRTLRQAVGHLVAEWLAIEGPVPDQSALLHVTLRKSSVRMDVSADPPKREPDFWAALITLAIEDTVSSWGVNPAGIWIEVRREPRRFQLPRE